MRVSATLLCVLLSMGSLTVTAGEVFEYELACGTPNQTSAQSVPALLLIGGAEAGSAGESGATAWFLAQGGGGDYLVVRSGGIGTQADWICSQFAAQLASAAELSVDSRAAAESPEVVALIAAAEMVFIAGGDQRDYVDLWRNTALANELQRHANTEALAGTSAGMMIVAESWYAPLTLGVLSSEILDDPFHPFTQEIGRGGMFYSDWLQRVIVDTHLDREHGAADENRYARLFGLLARSIADQNGRLPAYAIGAEEGAFIAIDSHGDVQVFGNGEAAGADGYFLQSDGLGPDRIMPGEPLLWTSRPVKAYRIAGTSQGSGLFALDGWLQAEGGVWLDWSTSGGSSGFNYLGGSCSACAGAVPPAGAMFIDGFE